MNKDDLRELLSQPYQFDNWKKVIDFTFPNVSYLQSPKVIDIDDESVESFRQIGTVRLNDGKNLAMFEVHVKPNVNLIRNRVALRKLVSQYIDQERNHGVLAIYEKGTEDYRFTFSAKETDYDEEKGDFVEKETEAKRYTYILGKNESCRTARDRFWELSRKKDEATIEDVGNAFSVEKLSKEFFNKYKEHYTAFVNYLDSSSYKISAFSNDEKAIRNFAKIMLGRIVFLHFLQKKGWLGASDENYQDGDKQFMYNLWQNSDKNEAYYQTILAPLFFDALNKNDRTDDAFKLPDERTIRIPFLGGGLFEKDRNEPDFLTFPKALFESLFDFFNEYNFTIDENDPHENEVGIDPEMLGHIFENLLEDNKDKGAFYTPKSIVKYMCQESLIQYLVTSFEKGGLIKGDEDKEQIETRIGNFVRKYEAQDIIEHDHLLAKALYNIKVCDPAIGSGAFPMGILNEMVFLINVLHNASPDVVEAIWEMDNWQPATVKKHIIQNSIYGVDIEKGAVDIARLRFWLSLIIDEEKPTALPSLDYKIVVGDSLLSKFEDEVIDIDWEVKEEVIQGNLFGDETEKARQKLLKRITQKQKEFFTAKNAEKEKLKQEIRKLKIDLLIHQLQLQVKTKGLENVQSQEKGKKLKQQTDLLLKTEGWKRTIAKLAKLKINTEKPFHHFDWRLDFPEVLNPEIAGMSWGFDVIIANPPYVDIKNLSSQLVRRLFKKFETAENRINLYSIFIEKSVSLLKENSIITFINPNSLLMNSSYKKIRKYLLDSMHKLIKLPDNIFEKAIVETIIFVAIKNQNSKFIKGAFYKNHEKIDFRNLKFNVFDSNLWREDTSNRYNIFISNEVERIIKKVDNQKLETLSSKFEFSLGITPYDKYKGHSESLIKNKEYHSATKINELYVPLISGKNILKFIVRNDITGFLKYGDWLGAPRQKKFFTKERVIVRQILSGSPPEIYAGYTDSELYHTQVGFSIINKQGSSLSLKALCALLNSKFINFYHKQKFIDPQKDIFQKILIENCKMIPFPENRIRYNCSIIEKYVSDILILKHKNEDSYELENQLDLMVYKLYDLTWDEVRVVDPEFWMSKEEYEAFEVEENVKN